MRGRASLRRAVSSPARNEVGERRVVRRRRPCRPTPYGPRQVDGWRHGYGRPPTRCPRYRRRPAALHADESGQQPGARAAVGFVRPCRWRRRARRLDALAPARPRRRAGRGRRRAVAAPGGGGEQARPATRRRRCLAGRRSTRRRRSALRWRAHGQRRTVTLPRVTEGCRSARGAARAGAEGGIGRQGGAGRGALLRTLRRRGGRGDRRARASSTTILRHRARLEAAGGEVGLFKNRSAATPACSAGRRRRPIASASTCSTMPAMIRAQRSASGGRRAARSTAGFSAAPHTRPPRRARRRSRRRSRRCRPRGWRTWRRRCWRQGTSALIPSSWP